MKIRVNINEGYDIIIKDNVLNEANEYLDLNRKVLIISDSGVPVEYMNIIKSQCAEPHEFYIIAGEQSKSLESFQEALNYLYDNNFTRSDCIIALGGGVVGDLAGFVAASYMRGIDFYNIPTTLLSQVDSSIGGKTGVNLKSAKNIVGAFYQPKGVLIDKSTLKTLDQRLLHEGLVEAFKMGLTSDASLVDLILCSNNLYEDIDEIIFKALMVKKNIVEQDEKESGIRRILNYGHTIGHAIEALSNGKYYHGECVGIGMLDASSVNVQHTINSFLTKYHLPSSTGLQLSEIIKMIRHDKKASGDEIYLVYLLDIEKPVVKKISIDELASALERGNLCQMF